jgi:hypothetical protein
MPAYENIMVTITLFLFFTNAVFLFAAFLPGTQTGTGEHINLGISATDINDMNNKINSLMNASNVFKPENIDVNAAVNASGQQKNYLTLFQSWLFGALDTATLGLSTSVFGSISILGVIISYFGATFFGYLFWIDFFINPAWGPGFFAIGAIFKIFFFIVQALWLFDIIYRMFFAGTGTRG